MARTRCYYNSNIIIILFLGGGGEASLFLDLGFLVACYLLLAACLLLGWMDGMVGGRGGFFDLLLVYWVTYDRWFWFTVCGIFFSFFLWFFGSSIVQMASNRVLKIGRTRSLSS